MPQQDSSATSVTSTTAAVGVATPDVHPVVQPSRVQLDVQGRVVFKVLLIAALFAVGVQIVLELRSLLVQLAVGVFLAVAADPVVRRLQRRGIGRGRAVVLVMVTVVVLAGLALSLFVPPLVEQGDRLVTAAPGIVHDVRDSALLDRLDQRFDVIDRASREAGKLPAIVGDQIGAVVAALLTGLLGTITILFLTIFLLMGGGRVMEGTVQLFPTLAERRWWTVIQGAYSGIAAYVGGAIIIALIGGSVLTITALLLGLPYALPLGLWMMLLEIIPLVGATIGAVPAIIVAFVAGGVVQGIVMIIVVIIYQQIENIVVQPRVQGKAAALSPLIVFVSVLVGSQLLGVLGALFAVPVAGVLQIFVQQIIEERGPAPVDLPPGLGGSEVGLPAPPPTDPDGGDHPTESSTLL